MTPMYEGFQLRLGYAHQSGLGALLFLRAALLCEASDIAGKKAASTSRRRLSRTFPASPESLARSQQPGVQVFCDLHVFLSPHDLQHASLATVVEQGRNPDALNLEVPRQQACKQLFMRHKARGGATDMPHAPWSFVEILQLQLVFEEQALGASRGRGCLVFLWTFRQGQQLSDSQDHRAWLASRKPSGLGVDPSLEAGSPKGGSMGGLLDGSKDLVGVLVRHLVLQHLHDGWPGLSQQHSRHGDGAGAGRPCAKVPV